MVPDFAVMVRARLDSWKVEPAPPLLPVPAAPMPAGARAELTGPGPLATVLVGHPGPGRNESDYYAFNLLNQVLGQSFYRYVNQARLQHLLDGLQATSDAGRIDELAFAAGFNSLSAFYKCFRERLGMTPKAYLKQISARARTQDSA